MKKRKKKEEPDYGTLQKAFDDFRELVLQGEPFKIDLARRNMYVGEHTVVKEGKFFGKIEDLDVGQGVLETIENLYWIYKRSVPGERSNRKEKSVTQFRALPFDELSDDDVLYGARREEAQYDLEAFTLFTILSGQLKWNDEWGTWYWKSEKDRDLVLLKNWMTGGTK